MSKQIQCPWQINISGMVRGCLYGYPPDTCDTCTHPSKQYVEAKSKWISYNPETGEFKEGGEEESDMGNEEETDMGGEVGVELARDIRYKENVETKKVDLDFQRFAKEMERENAIKMLEELEKQGEKTSVWSEEDENEYNHILKTLNLVAEEQETKGYNNLISSVNWLKSLKDRVQPQSQWKPSEEQIISLTRASNSLVAVEDTIILRNLLIDLLKLKE